MSHPRLEDRAHRILRADDPADPRREMHDEVGLVVGEQPLREARLREIAFTATDADDVVAAADKLRHEVRADEPCRTGDEDSHPLR